MRVDFENIEVNPFSRLRVLTIQIGVVGFVR